jgi:DNA-binding transcriptional LysR family regulator
MNLNSERLQAFFEIVRLGSFSAAARALFITQPSLSKRISLLEEELQSALLSRTRPVSLTERGRTLYDYCLRQKALEEEAIAEFRAEKKSNELYGFLRIAGLSSVISSTVVPVLSPFLRSHSKVQLQLLIGKSEDQRDLLTSRKADIFFLDHEFERPELEIETLGYEEFVLVESSKYKARENVYLDTGPHDPVTAAFFRIQKHQQPNYQRSFVHDTHGLLLGAAHGIGMAVVDTRSLHTSTYPLRIKKGFKSLKVPVVLHHFKWAKDSRLHQTVIEVLKKEVPKLLTSR